MGRNLKILQFVAAAQIYVDTVVNANTLHIQLGDSKQTVLRVCLIDVDGDAAATLAPVE
jgi:hypothetical protein